MLSFILTSGTWNSLGLGECWSSFCHHFWLNILHIEHMFCYLFASFLPYNSPFSSRYGHILIYASYVLFCIISWFSCLNLMICNDILIYENFIAESWSLANQQVGIAYIVDVRRAYLAHCPTHRSNRRINRALLSIDSWALNACNGCKLYWPCTNMLAWASFWKSAHMMPLCDTLTPVMINMGLYATSYAKEESDLWRRRKCHMVVINVVSFHNEWFILREVDRWKGQLDRPIVKMLYIQTLLCEVDDSLFQ